MNHLEELKRLYELAIKEEKKNHYKDFSLALEILDRIKQAESPQKNGNAFYINFSRCE